MAKIPRDVIDRIRNSVDISDVIGQYVQLKRAGKNYVGLCPFHEEQTPSFSVNAAKQYYYCFGCHKSGNVFQFLMDYQHIGFIEAVKEVAKFGGQELPVEYQEVSDQSTRPQNTETSQLINLHQQAAQLYHHILMNTPAGQPARNYLQRRGMSEQLMNQFNIGYAPHQRILQPFCQQQGIDYQLMRKSGLFTEDQAGELQDRFVERVMFPIKNRQGQVIAFSGRLLDTTKTDLPKYLNSPETPIFNKRQTLFNLDVARKVARQDGKFYLFEGFMDVISAFGAGVQNGIASMGTSFTEEQVRIISRQTGQLDICYDGDSAGQNAIDRAISLVNEHQNGQLQVRIVQLPAGIDPDEYVQQYGPAKFKSYLTDQEETTTDFYLRFLRNGKNLTNQNELLTYLDAALRVIARVPTPLGQDLYLQKLATEFHLDKATLKSQLQTITNQLGIRPSTPAQAVQQTAAVSYAPPVDQSQDRVSRTELAEQTLLHYMLHSPEAWAHVRAQDNFHFAHEKYQTIYWIAASFFAERGDYSVADFMDYLDQDDLRMTLGQVEQLNVGETVNMQLLDDCIRVIMHQTPLKKQITKIQNQLKEASALNNTELATQLTMKLVKLLQQQQQFRAEETN